MKQEKKLNLGDNQARIYELLFTFEFPPEGARKLAGQLKEAGVVGKPVMYGIDQTVEVVVSYLGLKFRLMPPDKFKIE